MIAWQEHQQEKYNKGKRTHIKIYIEWIDKKCVKYHGIKDLL